MIRLSTLVLFIILGIIYSVKTNEVTILALLQSFYYPSKHTLYHRWCDDNNEHNYCSPLFVICTTKLHMRYRRCLSKYIFGGSGPQYEHKKLILFTEQLGENITNPLKFTTPHWTNDTALHLAVFNKKVDLPSLLGRRSILLDWIKTPSTNESETWKEVYFTSEDTGMNLTALIKVFTS
ncbi:hypothetical protein MN116_004419 [Schistosoma mekongi]|uniref:Uncharacterized protein n=1 Tax=Schistosoma mekongi TaxID=38744 RepID=A0AAE2D6R1_SCHME|nr:hypothetical protein MN116_004419 [Schistosoma mekongi]